MDMQHFREECEFLTEDSSLLESDTVSDEYFPTFRRIVLLSYFRVRRSKDYRGLLDPEEECTTIYRILGNCSTKYTA
jgi:hypothetical protein